jgi:hypothetical protein
MVQPDTGRHQKETRKTQETANFLSVRLHKMEMIPEEEEKGLPHFSEKILGFYEQIK